MIINQHQHQHQHQHLRSVDPGGLLESGLHPHSSLPIRHFFSPSDVIT
ncbi:Uncharacterised protein [Yersinia pseudotuberculosis]|nr:hypothetical protein BZ19_1305 [Yersinia pseudotuberculosis str. PA3606]UFA61789.1 Uncharacterized protein YP598_2169 [Yersinia pseudotuberculosis]CNH17455.1 Uncharacterised protein [Yersinia pseudotuberculosis]CNH42094.1 Uncharacterised protein [Yersinia pseudotuberculosis]CNL08288.1 Uncharacterised protein [Yersinia pseudotuberculosis]